MFVPEARRPSKYDNDYKRFDAIDSDSDSERQALAPSLRDKFPQQRASAADERDLVRELESHVASLSAREAVSALRQAQSELAAMTDVERARLDLARATQEAKSASASVTEAKAKVAALNADVRDTEVRAEQASRRADDALAQIRQAAASSSDATVRKLDHLASIKCFTVTLDRDGDAETDGSIAVLAGVRLAFPVAAITDARRVTANNFRVAYDRLARASQQDAIKIDLDPERPRPPHDGTPLECRVCGASIVVAPCRRPPSNAFALSKLDRAVYTGADDDLEAADAVLLALEPRPNEPLDCGLSLRVAASDVDFVASRPTMPPRFLVAAARDRKAYFAHCARCRADLGICFREGPLCLYKHRLGSPDKAVEFKAHDFVAALVDTEFRVASTPLELRAGSARLAIRLLANDGHAYRADDSAQHQSVHLQPVLKLAFSDHADALAAKTVLECVLVFAL